MREGGLLANIATVRYRHSIAMGQFLSLKDLLKLLISACSKNSQENTSWCVNMLNETLVLCFAIIFQAKRPRFYRHKGTLQSEFLTRFYKVGFFTFVRELEMLQKKQWEALKVYDNIGDNSLILLDNLSRQQKTIQISDIAPDDQIKPLARSIYAIVLAPKQTGSIVVSLNPLLEMLTDESTFLDALETLTVLFHKLDVTDIETQYHEVIGIFLDKLRAIEHPNCHSYCTGINLLDSFHSIFLKFKTTEHQLWFIGRLIGMLKDLKREFRRPVLSALEKWMPRLNETAVQFVVDHVSALFEEGNEKSLEIFCDILEDLPHCSIYKSRLGLLLVDQLKQSKNQAITDCFLFRLNHARSMDKYFRTEHAIVALAPQLHTAWLLEWIVEVLTDSERKELRDDTALSMMSKLIPTVENDWLQRMGELLFMHIDMPQPWEAGGDVSMICQLIDRFEPTDVKKYTDRILALIGDHPPSNQFVSWEVVNTITGLKSKFEMEDVLLLIKRLAINIDPTKNFNTRNRFTCSLERWIVTMKSMDVQRLIEPVFAMLNDARPMVRYYALCMLKQVIKQSETVSIDIWQWVPLLLKTLNERDCGVDQAALNVFLALINQFEAAALEQCLLFICEFDYAEDDYQAIDHLFIVLDSIIVRRPHLSAVEAQKVSAFLLKQRRPPETCFHPKIFSYLAEWRPKLDATLCPSWADYLLNFLDRTYLSPQYLVLDAIHAWMPAFSATEIQRLNSLVLRIINKSNPYYSVFHTCYFDKILRVIHRMLELNNSEISLHDLLTFLLKQLRCYEADRIASKVQATLLLLMSKLEANDMKVLMDFILARFNVPMLSQRKTALWMTITMFPLIGEEIMPWITALIKLFKDEQTTGREEVLEGLILFIPNMKEQDAIWVVTELMSYLNHANINLRNELFNAIKAIISYHPQYTYSLNSMSESLEKFYVTLMLDMVKIAESLNEIPFHAKNPPPILSPTNGHRILDRP